MRGRALLYPIAVLAITVSGFAIEDPAGYCQLKPNLAPSRCGATTLIPEKSMDYVEANGLFSVQFSLS